MAPSASEKAKAKFFAVIEDPKRYDTTCYKNRMMPTRTPSSGSELTNVVKRRESSSSTGSNNDQHRVRNMLKRWISPPAY
ncbi:hypothetical protein CMUS01_06591 [Colletotrichum musicola]|uniref:Uncharacterized protein n=3 Tax=Colletotrichum orchidearum species complex TaxID=2707337 RepID=A0A8H6NI12_9PEZI|nr:hypothetical protein CSOJ01_11437 [Colletotrichum sojae]KAF6813358.1 hypothetical protein CPLU01_14675 [Colletotrichum plurivorum]KAF6833345.1 hypothetical protein CMUS01_06591 [Colletotrichum musicola]